MTTASDYRDMAAESRQRAADSWENSDTDGFVSQWASGITAREYDLKAEVEDNGGKSEFSALFDLEGNLVPAKLVDTQYGRAWGLLSSDDATSPFKGWFSPSNAATDSHRIHNNAKKGYYEGTVMAPAGVTTTSRGRGLGSAGSVCVITYRKDRGFSRDVEILDNGK